VELAVEAADLGGDVVGQRAWRRHSALGSGFGVGIGDEPERVSWEQSTIEPKSYSSQR
jgi:hypothetical protein